MIIRRFGYEESYHRHRLTQNPSLSTALVAQGHNKSRPSCAHCKKLGHFTEFCIQSGGKMAGQSIEEARAALNKQPKDSSTTVTSTANVAASTGTTGSSGTTDLSTVSTATSGANTVSAPTSRKALIVDGVTYYPSVPSTACVAMSSTARISPVPSEPRASSVSSLSSFCSYLAISGPRKASVDWNTVATGTCPPPHEIMTLHSRSARALVSQIAKTPFHLDSGATNHISPEHSDFKNLHAIEPHAIEGFNGSSTNAIGVGDIDLCIASGHKLLLRDVLYIPQGTTHLISISAVADNGYTLITFGKHECWIHDRHNKIIVRGSRSSDSGLYTLHCTSARVARAKLASSVLYTKRVPNMETWHRRLGHCNNRTIIDMARKGCIKGMAIDLSSSPPKCDHCILGKQT